jgi:hypothetical protein
MGSSQRFSLAAQFCGKLLNLRITSVILSHNYNLQRMCSFKNQTFFAFPAVVDLLPRAIKSSLGRFGKTLQACKCVAVAAITTGRCNLLPADLTRRFYKSSHLHKSSSNGPPPTWIGVMNDCLISLNLFLFYFQRLGVGLGSYLRRYLGRIRRRIFSGDFLNDRIINDFFWLIVSLSEVPRPTEWIKASMYVGPG